MRKSLTLVALAVLGCGGDDEPGPLVEPPASCAPGEWRREDGSCVPPGLPPDMPCPPAEWLRDDGVCIPAGVPPDGCGEGFVHDGDRGCESVLPDGPCPPGLMAVPGETVCREVAPCAPGKWGDIPVESNTEYVDASYAGMDSDGSALKPWTSIQAGVDAASPGAIVAIAQGSYLEDVLVSGQPVRLWGVCPRLVEVVGSGAELAAVVMYGGASGSEVRDLAMSGDAIGFVLSGSLDVVLQRVWVHESAGRGIVVQNDLGPTRMTLRGALVEQNQEVGVFLWGSEATIDATVVRTTLPDAQGLFGRGVSARADSATGTPSTFSVQRSVVEQNHGAGVYMEGSEATIDAIVVRSTLPNTGEFGRGVNVQADSTLSLMRSLVEQNHEVGVYVSGSQATIDATVVRATQVNAHGLSGRGVNGETDPATGAPSTLFLQRSLVELNHEVGVYVSGSEATIDATVVRTTQLTAFGLLGRGVSAEADPATAAPAGVLVQRSLVEQSRGLGVSLVGSEATVDATVIRATQPNAHGALGRGVNVELYLATGAPSTLLLERSLIEQSREAAVFIIGSDATIASCQLRDTLPNSAGVLGEGVAVVSEAASASATITATRIERSARAALAAWGAHAAIGGSALSCQAFDVDYETYKGTAATLDDMGGNVCGCPEATATCVGVSANLDPPTVLEPTTP